MALWSAFLARPSRPRQIVRPSLTLFFLLAGAYVLTLVPHVIQFPFWLSVTIVIAMVARCVLEAWRLPLPSTTFTTIIALILLSLVFLQYGGHIVGRDPGTALTAGLLAIKFYELRGPRDVSLIIFSCFFVIMSALLYSQALELFIYCLIMMWVLTSLLVRVHTGDRTEDNLLRMLRLSGVVFLQAFPFALFLFFFFPRVSGPLGLSLDEATIGLTDTLTPGSIAKLSQNDNVAMYVKFEPGGAIPLPGSMYWRALVLWDYNHGAWTPGEMANNPNPAYKARIKADPGEIQQTVTVNAHHKKWLFALDTPVTLPVNASELTTWAKGTTSDTVGLSYRPINLDHLARYTVISSVAPPAESLGAREGQAAILLPDDPGDKTHPPDKIAPKVKALADFLHKDIPQGNVDAYINAVIHYFRHNGFIYSAEPGAQGPDWLPYFLFENKKGFCEHYASAFAVLMRCENFPTRLVVGYVGAEYNPYEDTYTVSQSRAHAWDEVWIRDPDQAPAGIKGHWRRIDPTALITAAEPPGRLDSDANNPDDPRLIRTVPRPLSFAERHLPTWMNESMKEVRLRRQEVEINWDNLVLSYDTGTQGRLAQALGFGDTFQVGLFLSCLSMGAVCIFIFQRWITRKVAISPVETLYALFCRNMARRGIPRAAWEGPLAYTERLAEAFPDDKLSIQRVGSIVSRARYGPAPVDPSTPDALQSLLNKITASSAAATSRERR
jgi:transglutaminase-like putative cysteine protease